MGPGSLRTQSEGQWLQRDAEYSGDLPGGPGRPDVVPGNWTLKFAIETVARDTTVVLPLVRNEAQWNTTAMLDGVPLPLEWHAGGRECDIAIAEPGRYSLVITCIPKATSTDGDNLSDLTIPPLMGARVELRFPENASDLTVPHMSILPPLAGEPKVLSGELERIGRLHVQWPRPELLESGKQGLSVTELRWLHITPAQVDLEVKYVLEGGAHRPDSLILAYDKRWKMLTEGKSTNDAHSAKNSREQYVVRVPIPSQDTDRQEILLRFRLLDPPALGNLRVPPIELMAPTAIKRWLAVSTDPSLECEVADPSLSEGTVNEFFAKWGSPPSSDSPQLVFSNLGATHVRNLAIRPREVESLVDGSLNVAAGRSALRVIYVAKVTPGNFGAHRLELSVPTNLSIGGITVDDADRHIPLRWSRPADNRITVFFGEELANPYRLVLSGRTPLAASDKSNLPRVSAKSTDAATQQVRLYRDDNVHVELEGFPPSAESKGEPIDPPLNQWAVRPVAVYYLDKAAAETARITVMKSQLRMSGQTLTALTRQNGAWSAEYRCQLSVADGDLDVFGCECPRPGSGRSTSNLLCPPRRKSSPLMSETQRF